MVPGLYRRGLRVWDSAENHVSRCLHIPDPKYSRLEEGNKYKPCTPLVLLLAVGAPVYDFLATDFPPVEGRPFGRFAASGTAVPVRLDCF